MFVSDKLHNSNYGLPQIQKTNLYTPLLDSYKATSLILSLVMLKWWRRNKYRG